MPNRIIVDPISRIEGHLRIEADMDKGKIENAYSSGTTVRGIELILKDRDPRDAWVFTQRICGICTTVHALASLRSVEDALRIDIPKNANLIRNIMNAANYIHDHVIHFYHLHALDWVDVVAALKADPKEASNLAYSISNWPKSSPGYFQRVLEKIKQIVESDQLTIFTNGYWGHPLYKLPPEANLIFIAHYLEALDWQRDIMKILTIFGGKSPHPHYAVGGMATPIDLKSETAVNASKLAMVSDLIDQANEFVEKVYLPDLYALVQFYGDWLYGSGIQNYLVYGDFPKTSVYDRKNLWIPNGAIVNGNLEEIHPVDPWNEEDIQESVDRSWYEYEGEGKGRHPWQGQTVLNYTGPKPPFDYLNTDDKYSWVKTPRWKGKLMEVGPLARILVAYAAKHNDFKPAVDEALQKVKIPLNALSSALGRNLARGLETRVIGQHLRRMMDELIANIKVGDQTTFNGEKWDPSTWPSKAKGAGFMEAPRGGLGHWCIIEKGKIKNYQAIVPSTWNAAPRDSEDTRGALETSLLGTPVQDPKQPLEILRIIHSFDPCLACAVHLMDLENNGNHSIAVK